MILHIMSFSDTALQFLQKLTTLPTYDEAKHSFVLYSANSNINHFIFCRDLSYNKIAEIPRDLFCCTAELETL